MTDCDTPRIIAVEEHFTTSDYFDNLENLAFFPGEEAEHKFFTGFSGNRKMIDQFRDPDVRRQAMDEAGIDMFVMSLNPPGVQMFSDGAKATSLVRDANDELAQMIKAEPDRLFGVGSLAPQEPEQAAREVKRIMGELKLGGVMIASHTNGVYLDQPECEPILAALEEEDATLYLHPRCPSQQMVGAYTDYGMVGALWGFQAEAGTHAIRLIMSGALDRHPKLRIVLGHLGEALPYWMWRLDNIYGKTMGWEGKNLGMVELKKKPSDYFHENFYITMSGMSDPDVIRYAVDRVGADRVMFAVDFPYEDPNVAVKGLRDTHMEADERERVAHRNAETLFRIPSAPKSDGGR